MLINFMRWDDHLGFIFVESIGWLNPSFIGVLNQLIRIYLEIDSVDELRQGYDDD